MSVLTGVAWVLLGGVSVLPGFQGQEISDHALVINEFMAKNEGTVEDPDEKGKFEDWIEIFNTSDTPIDIGGLYVTDDLNDPGRVQIPLGHPELTTVPGKGYLLIWADSDPKQGPLHVNLRLDANSGEDIGLYMQGQAGMVLIDGLSFGRQERDMSSGRSPDGTDLWRTFRLHSDDPPTPGKANGSGAVNQHVVINEIMYHPSTEDDRDEYLELHNRTDQPVDLEGWEFTEGISFKFDDVVMAPGEYLVVAADVDRFRASYPDVTTRVMGGWKGRLSNKGETLRLVDAGHMTVDSVSYYDEGVWAERLLSPLDHTHRGWTWHNGHDREGRSLEVINPDQSNDYGQNWGASMTGGGTPGAENSVYDLDTAPIIRRVIHSPAIPSSSDQVTVTAEAIDTRGLDRTVTLFWRVDASHYDEDRYPVHEPDTYAAVTMTINQAGQYVAAIPALADLTLVEFYVAVEDTLGRMRSFPAPSRVDGTPQQVTNLLYQVDNTFASDKEGMPTGQPVYRLVMTQAEHDRLADIGDQDISGNWWASEAMSQAQMNATFISVDEAGTQVRYNVGVRNRGNRSRFDPPMNFHVNFRHDDAWQGRFAMNLNSKFVHSQVIASAFYQLAGVEAANVEAVQLRVNGSHPAASDPDRTFGSYAAVQVLDGLWAEEHAPDDPDGNLYRGTYDMRHGYRTVADLIYLGEDPDRYRENYYKKTNELIDDWSDLIDLTHALNDANVPDEAFVDHVGRIVDIEQWTRFFAADTLVGNREKGLYSGMGDDYALYCGAEDRRCWLVPHDLDTVLGQGDEGYHPEQDILSYQDVPGLHRLMNHPEVRALYYDQIRDLTETLFTPDVMNALIDELLGDWVSDEALNGVEGMKQFVVDRLYHVVTGPNAQVPGKD